MQRLLRSASRWSGLVLRHRYGATLFAYLAAALLTGAACVLFMRAFEWVIAWRLDESRIGAWVWVSTPLLFLVAVGLVRHLAPQAAGTGIPQAIFAARHLTPTTEDALAPLLSARTIAIKILSLLIAIYACASSGREGPTVHVAAGVFMGVMWMFRRWGGVAFDARSAVVAGGSAGLAAAFNTPLAGVTFAVEEMTKGHFGAIKDFVLVAIVVAALAAKALTGEYTYFGRLTDPPAIALSLVLVIGLTGGLLGSLFSSAILNGQRWLERRRAGWHGAAVTALLAIGLLAVAALGNQSDVFGPGNLAAQRLVRGEVGPLDWLFPFQKLLATLCTYWSGIAGGIFAPCLSIGAGAGALVARLAGGSTASCALVGMAAFLSGTIQAPITAFVIIFEMTGHHEMLLPVMLGSLLAFMVARLRHASHLYPTLSENYRTLLPDRRRAAASR